MITARRVVWVVIAVAVAWLTRAGLNAVSHAAAPSASSAKVERAEFDALGLVPGHPYERRR